MPVLPLVGSISSLPAVSMPLFSASHTMAAPMRHFTEYAGLRPSIFPSTRALAPSVTRLRRTSGVRPILSELSSKMRKLKSPANSNLPGVHVAVLAVGPGPNQFRECGLVDYLGHSMVHLLPHIGERRAGL